MARSKINSRSKDIIKDDGAVLISVVEGEQLHMGFTVGWVANLSGYTITAKIVEADMAGANDDDGYPVVVKSGGQVVDLTVIIGADNTFKIVIPSGLHNGWTASPTPNNPVYGFVGIEIKDAGVGDAQQIWKPFRGLVEVLYSPSGQV